LVLFPRQKSSSDAQWEIQPTTPSTLSTSLVLFKNLLLVSRFAAASFRDSSSTSGNGHGNGSAAALGPFGSTSDRMRVTSVMIASLFGTCDGTDYIGERTRHTISHSPIADTGMRLNRVISS
jgi:hypothetical protein